jgi:hypothetical protein
MLKDVLGYMIAPDGEFISFGKWVPTLDFNTGEKIYQYSAINSLIFNKWNLKYKELGLDAFLDPHQFSKDIFTCFKRWSELGFTFIINYNTVDTFKILGYFPTSTSFFQKMAFLLLSNDILYQENITSEIFLNGIHDANLNIYSIYEHLLEELFLEDRKRERSFKGTAYLENDFN